MSNGFFIVIDGPDGVGKSKIVLELYERLKNIGYDVLKTKEITSGPIGELIKNNEFNGLILAELVAADRIYHNKYEILPALSCGKIVISDRYVASSYVCQQLDGVPLDFIMNINSEVVHPDLSIFVSADASVIEKRLLERKCLNRLEKISVSKMIELYDEAVRLFKKNDYGQVIKLKNNNETDFECNIETILQTIKNHLGKKTCLD